MSRFIALTSKYFFGSNVDQTFPLTSFHWEIILPFHTNQHHWEIILAFHTNQHHWEIILAFQTNQHHWEIILPFHTNQHHWEIIQISFTHLWKYSGRHVITCWQVALCLRLNYQSELWAVTEPSSSSSFLGELTSSTQLNSNQLSSTHLSSPAHQLSHCSLGQWDTLERKVAPAGEDTTHLTHRMYHFP